MIPCCIITDSAPCSYIYPSYYRSYFPLLTHTKPSDSYNFCIPSCNSFCNIIVHFLIIFIWQKQFRLSTTSTNTPNTALHRLNGFSCAIECRTGQSASHEACQQLFPEVRQVEAAFSCSSRGRVSIVPISPHRLRCPLGAPAPMTLALCYWIIHCITLSSSYYN